MIGRFLSEYAMWLGSVNDNYKLNLKGYLFDLITVCKSNFYNELDVLVGMMEMNRSGFLPLFILATVTLTTTEVEGVSVIVTIFTEVAGVDVIKWVEVLSLGVKKVVVVAERKLLTVVALTVNDETVSDQLKRQRKRKLFIIESNEFIEK